MGGMQLGGIGGGAGAAAGGAGLMDAVTQAPAVEAAGASAAPIDAAAGQVTAGQVPMPDANPTRTGEMPDGYVSDALMENINPMSASGGGEGVSSDQDSIVGELYNKDLKKSGVPENHQEFEDALDARGTDPRAAALMQAMGMMEYPHLANEPGAYSNNMGGKGGKMRGVLQTNTNVHKVGPTPDDYMDLQEQFWGGGRTPTGGAPFDIDAAWEALRGEAAKGPITGDSFQRAIPHGGFGHNDYHPLGVKGAGKRIPDYAAEYLYNKGQGPVTHEELQRAFPEEEPFVGF